MDDHGIVRKGLRALLEREPDITVVGEAENGQQAVTMARDLNPSVIVMDVAMPLLNGLDAMQQILQGQPSIKILILSGYRTSASVAEAIAKGASGYLLKHIAPEKLPEAIRGVHEGKPCFEPAIRGVPHLSEVKGNELSTREREVLQLIARGKANKETAAELQISVKTVEKHRQNLMGKLNIHDTAGLTRHAISTGLLESST